MNCLIIPDIHTKIDIAQKIIDDNPADMRVFLGDIYDDFADNPVNAKRTAVWHKETLADPKNHFLFGNHDMHYAFPDNRHLRCSGFTLAKSAEIREVMEPQDWLTTRLFCCAGSWLLSHAGLNPSLGYTSVEDLEERCEHALDAAAQGVLDPLTNAGQSRNGSGYVGGLTWQDWNHEFKPLKGWNQIVGHTCGFGARQYKDTNNWCLDTDLRFAAMIHPTGPLEIITVR